MTNSPWDGLEINQARRVNSQGKHDFFWVRMPDRSPALLLRLADDVSEIRPLPKLKYVGVIYRHVDGQNCYCLTLGEGSHLDIFETLCRDVVEAAEQAPDNQSALARALRRTLRWHHLLRGGSARGMSLEEQRGLVGELAFLRELCEFLNPYTAVAAWQGTGQEGGAKDFEMNGVFFEIKSRRSAAHPKVRISSEAQLMGIEGARFFLRVQDVDTTIADEGDNLQAHVEKTGRFFDGDLAALDVWEQRLASTGYSPEHVEEERRWQLGAGSTFEVLEGFPRLVPPLPQGVDNVEYTIRLDACMDFRREQPLEALLNGDYADV